MSQGASGPPTGRTMRWPPPHPKVVFAWAGGLGAPGIALAERTDEQSLALLLPGGLLVVWLAFGFLRSRAVWDRYNRWWHQRPVPWRRGKRDEEPSYFGPERAFGGI